MNLSSGQTNLCSQRLSLFPIIISNNAKCSRPRENEAFFRAIFRQSDCHISRNIGLPFFNFPNQRGSASDRSTINMREYSKWRKRITVWFPGFHSSTEDHKKLFMQSRGRHVIAKKFWKQYSKVLSS